MTKNEISAMLMTRDLAVARALVFLYNRQTADEKVSEDVKHRNGMGFTPADARMGCSMAEFYKKNNYMTQKQLDYWRKPNSKGVPRICKYAAQIAASIKGD